MKISDTYPYIYHMTLSELYSVIETHHCNIREETWGWISMREDLPDSFLEQYLDLIDWDYRNMVIGIPDSLRTLLIMRGII